jgi:hypothetical protein
MFFYMKFTRLLTLVAFLFLGLSAAFAQTTTTGAVNGVITDQSGAVVPGAIVTLKSIATGAVQTAKSSNSGSYRFDLLPPGAYVITVDIAGFQKLESKLQVDISQVISADLKLTVGSNSVTVDVDTVATLLNAENGNVATTMSQLQVEEVPNSGNNMASVRLATPGMNTGFGVVGSTQYLVDGLNFNDPYNNASNSGASNLMLGLNNVQEATVTGNGYSGQFGGLIGAQVSFISKSGANRVHGDASWYWSGRSLVANTWAHKYQYPAVPITPRSFENANQWSASISGPIVIPHLFNGHDKLFFLADAEGLRAILPASPVTVAVPSAGLQSYIKTKLAANGLGASIPFYQNMFNIYNKAAAAHITTTGNTAFSETATFPNADKTGCPTTVSSATVTSSNPIPLNPTAISSSDLQGLGFTKTASTATNGAFVYNGPTGACASTYASNAITFANEALEIFRVDFVATQNEKMYIRYEHDSGTQPTTIDPIDPLFNAISIQPEHNGQFNETHTFGARAVNNLLIGASWYGALFGPASLPAQLAEFPAQLSVSDGSLSGLGGSIASFPTGRNVTNIQLQDDLALTLGSHTIKVGGKGYVSKENDHYFTAGTVPNETVATLGAFINGGFDNSDTGPNFQTTANGVVNYTWATAFAQTFPTKPNHPVLISQIAGYVEDDWKTTHELSLTMALRLEHQGNVKCLDNCLTQLATQFPNLNHAATIPYNQAYLFNQENVFPGLQTLEWEPRFGFAYNPKLMHESFVVRGGIGIFFDGLPGNILEGVAKNPPTKNTFSVSQDYLANTETTSNLWNDTQAYNTAFASGITGGGTVATIKASLPTPAERNSFTPPSVYAPQNNFKMYYVTKWNLEVQKSFGSKTVLSINYLGNHGVHKAFTNPGLNAFSSTGAIAGLPTAQPDTRFGTVYYFQSGGSTNYNGAIATFTRRFSQGSVFTAGYTYGKILDNTGAVTFSTTTSTGTTDIGGIPDPYNPGRYYGPASTDERHNLTLNYVYQVPFKNIFYGGWEVSGAAYAYSGLPITVLDTAGSSAISSYAKGAYGASLVANYSGGGQKHCNYGQDACLSAAQFSSATSVDSNQGRNAFRGPMYISTDLAVNKDIPLHWEGGRFSVSAQAFNVLNHLNFKVPVATLNNGSFGKITATVNPSGLFSGVGGDDSPRILQLKAKIVF